MSTEQQPYFYPVPVPAPQYPPAPRPGHGLGVASMVLGIVAWSVAFLSFGFLTPLSVLLGLVGLPLGAVALNKGEHSGRAMTGVILGAVGLGLVTLVMVYSLVVTFTAS